ncbi:MAG TPA: HigA family addiction module antitoxin [Bryobacterales bacterium]|nr:HigA family addiction module antitoxin [Bryobacterales bacterium]
MPMKNPPHPGLSVRIDCLDPLGLSVTEAARKLGVSRATLSRLVHEQAGISPEMAIRFEKAGWSTADTWLRMQAAYELAQARAHEDQIIVGSFEPRPAA